MEARVRVPTDKELSNAADAVFDSYCTGIYSETNSKCKRCKATDCASRRDSTDNAPRCGTCGKVCVQKRIGSKVGHLGWVCSSFGKGDKSTVMVTKDKGEL